MLWLLLVAVGAALYFGWALVERRRHTEAHAVAADVAALGADLVPTSLHPSIDPDRCMGSGACVAACPEEQVLAVIDGRARLINPLACIGHGACMAACPVSAIELVFGTASRGVELPVLTPAFETTRPGIYVVGELGGMGLIRNAIEQGRQAAAHLAASPRRGGNERLDALVVGAGPSGLGAALELLRRGLSVKVLEEGELGGTIAHYPRSKIVMTGPIELPGVRAVTGRTMSKEALIELWREAHAGSGLNLRTGVRATGVRPDGDAWIVEHSAGEERAASVILALGRRGAPRRLGVPGEELDKVHYRLREPEVFAGQEVLVVGGGNAAADCVIALAEQGRCASVGLSYRRPELARLRASVRDRLDELLRGGKVLGYLPSELKEISPQSVTLETQAGLREIPNDAVIVQIGGTAPRDLMATFGLETIEKRGER